MKKKLTLITIAVLVAGLAIAAGWEKTQTKTFTGGSTVYTNATGRIPAIKAIFVAMQPGRSNNVTMSVIHNSITNRFYISNDVTNTAAYVDGDIKLDRNAKVLITCSDTTSTNMYTIMTWKE